MPKIERIAHFVMLDDLEIFQTGDIEYCQFAYDFPSKNKRILVDSQTGRIFRLYERRPDHITIINSDVQTFAAYGTIYTDEAAKWDIDDTAGGYEFSRAAYRRFKEINANDCAQFTYWWSVMLSFARERFYDDIHELIQAALAQKKYPDYDSAVFQIFEEGIESIPR